MAEASKKKPGASDAQAPDVLDTLARADENITRMHEDAKARKAEKAKQMRRTDSDDKARREDVRAKRAAQQKQSDMIAEQKLAAFKYAEDYRKKLIRDRERMQSAGKQRDMAVRAEAEAALRAEREAELERIREREHAEARARSERASALLNRVTKCAVRDDDGNVRMVDRSELAKIEAERARAAAEKAAEEAALKAQMADETSEQPVSEPPATAMPDKDEMVSAIVSAFKEGSPLYKEYEGMAREQIAARRVEDFFIGEMMDTTDGKFVLNIIEDDFTVSITSEDDDSIMPPVMSASDADDEVEESIDELDFDEIEDDEIEADGEIEADESAEESAEEPAKEDAEPEKTYDGKYPPVELKNPIIFDLRTMGAEAVGFFDLWKYMRKVRKHTRMLHESVDMIADRNRAEGQHALPTSILEEITMHIDIINIRCDALTNCVRLAADEPSKIILALINRYSDKQAQDLYLEIDAYNKAAIQFRRVTGEDLTMISPFLPERILAKTGAPVLPAYECRQKFIEGFMNQKSKPNNPYTLVFPSFKDMVNGMPIKATQLDQSKQMKIKRIIEDVLFSAMTKAPSVYNEEVKDAKSYKKNLRLAKKIVFAIDKRIEINELAVERTGGSQMLAIEIMNLEKEKALIAFHRLANSLKTGKVKYTVQAKSYVIDAIKEYNTFAKKYAKMAEIDLMKYGMPLADYILNAGVVPETPVFMTRTDIFETVGDNTRLVGERVDEDLSEYQLVFGDVSGVPTPTEPPKRIVPDAADEPAEPSTPPKKKYMAADDFDTVYLTIPFEDQNTKSGKKSKMNSKKKNAYDLAEDETITIAGASGASGSGTRISISTEREPAPVKVERGSAKTAQTEQGDASAEFTRETIDVLAKALSDAAKIAEMAEKYAATAEKAAQIIEKYEKSESQYAIDGVAQPMVQEVASKGDVEAVRNMSKGQIRSFLANADSKLKNARREYAKAEALKDAARPDAKPRLTIGCIAASKAVIDQLSSTLAAYSNVMDTDGINKVKRDLYLEINNYNELVGEYERIAGGKLTVASLSMVEDIISGRPYQTLPFVKFVGKDGQLKERRASLAVLETGVPAPSKEMKIINREQLHAYLSRQEGVLAKYRHKLAAAERKISLNSHGNARSTAIVDAVAAERKIINELCEHLLAACQASSYPDTSRIKKAIGMEIKNHNALVAELEKNSGEFLTPASKDMAQEIISGLDYKPLPDVTYSLVNPVVTTVDKINEAIEKGKELYAGEIMKEGHLSLANIASKVAAQANKDVAVLTHCAAFEVSLLESDRDILRYGHGGEMPKFKRRRRKIARLIKSIKRNNKRAVKYEQDDNRRYYQIVTTNPETMETKTPRPNRKRMAELRKRMIELLNERDKINNRLTAIYTCEEYNLDGTGVNQTWRRVKADAIEKAVRQDEICVMEIKHLPTSESEKAKIFDLLNKRLDAVSTIALCKYRIKNEQVDEKTKNKLMHDKRSAEKLIKSIDLDIKSRVDKIYERNKNVEDIGVWFTIIGCMLLFIALCVGVYFVLFHNSLTDIFNSIKETLAGLI